MPTISERLHGNISQGILGRERELALLLRCLDEDGPLAIHVHGMSGIGKTALLRAFAMRAPARGMRVVSLDCSVVEPTRSGFLRSLSEELACCVRTPEEAAEVLAGAGGRIVLTLDHYEVLRLLDAWLRHEFVPALPDSVRVVFASRLPATAQWLIAPEWHGLFRPLHLDPLGDEAARGLVARAGVTGEPAQRIVEFAHGHPLALKLAATLASQATPNEDASLDAVLHHLSQLYLGEVEDEGLRDALRALCVVRRITRPLIEAMLPTLEAGGLMERVARLPFIESDSGGLAMHEAIREAVAAEFEALDPAGFRACRRAAWRHLSKAASEANASELWRYTADLIYILRNPVVREAFFPRESVPLAVEPARPEHRDAIREIASLHEVPEARRQLDRWWSCAPHVFSVVLHPSGEVAGFYAMFDPSKMPERQLLDDPLVAQWWKHLKENRLPKGQRALFLRRWLGVADGEKPSPVQASAWLDIKRHYMELRPRLRRVYLGLADPAPYAEVASRLGFKMLPRCAVAMEASTYHTAMLDMGPGSVEGWLSWLVGAELGGDSQDLLDVGARALRVDEGAVPLTRLEFEVMQYLWLRQGAAVSRDALLGDVWGQNVDASSNVVDTVVAALRRKLGKQAKTIGTVRGYGYICRDTTRADPASLPDHS